MIASSNVFMIRTSQLVLGTPNGTGEQYIVTKGETTANAISVNHLLCGRVRKHDFLFSADYGLPWMRNPLGICTDNTEQILLFKGWDPPVLLEGLPLLRLCSSEWSSCFFGRNEKNHCT